MTTDKPLPCPNCFKIILSFLRNKRELNAQGLNDTRDWAKQHVSLHESRYIREELQPKVKEIAEEKR